MIQVLKKYWVLLLFALLIIIGVIYFISVSQKTKAELQSKDDTIKLLIDLKEKELSIQKNKYEVDSIRYVKNIDSATSLYNTIEAARKIDFNYYQNKINALKKFNTYSGRQHLADSLAGTN